MEPTASHTTLDDAHAVLADSPSAVWWGLGVEAVSYGTAAVSLPSAPHLLRPGGVLQGASYEVVADVAMWLAIMPEPGSTRLRSPSR